MKPNASVEERFEGWYVQPIKVLKDHLPEGDGGIIALSVALVLCERYYRVKTGTHDKFDKVSNKKFKKAAALDLGLNENDFEVFWAVYRNGTQHQGIPIEQERKGKKFKWRTHDNFSAIPTFHPLSGDTYEILLNPWKFTDLIIEKYKQDKAILEKLFEHAFAVVN